MACRQRWPGRTHCWPRGRDGTSRSFVVPATAASHLTFMVQPAGATVGGNLGMVTVQVDDAFGNPIPGQTVTITGSATTLTGAKSAVTTPRATRSSAACRPAGAARSR